ncbi:glycosyltransferase family 2 protein [Mucilaginibacter sp. dw_454]|uniref:glycosyltransferase family 2 protein n=1 Tax=Mucilaginibacter sp. dw_454 TaxID=2720079 RepID=UPI001BD5C3CC|nr:glycosyltransferase family 2 protein [Mucilaginibacter sp. dw_454]
MPRCRIYLFTYNRNGLLPRAIESLLNQTFTDWVCELHNDMPGNVFPAEYIAVLNDSRFLVIDHEKNLGAIKSFNLAFEKCGEDFISILEDDNWWEPDFLEKMIAVLDTRPAVQLAWCNMRLHKELPGNNWEDTGKTTWEQDPLLAIKTFDFPKPKQAFSYLHSIGAMLVRNVDLQKLQIPVDVRLDFIEPIRERAFSHPIVLVNEPLANFAITISTNRAAGNEGVHEHYYLLLASFFQYAANDEALIKGVWAEVRKSTVRSTHNLLLAGLLDSNCRGLLKYAGFADWLFFFAYNVRYPKVVGSCRRAKTTYAALWQYLKENTALRFETRPN